MNETHEIILFGITCYCAGAISVGMLLFAFIMSCGKTTKRLGEKSPFDPH